MADADLTDDIQKPETPERSMDGINVPIESPPFESSDAVPDTRLYLPDHDEWDIHIKRDSDRFFCYSKHPGEDWFHLLLNGEIYVTRQHEKYCLRCALRMGILTTDRLFWQHTVPKLRKQVL